MPHLVHGTAPVFTASDASTHSDLDRKTGLEVFVDMSVSETLFHLIVVGATPPAGGVQGRDGVLLAEASALQKRLRVPDKRFWYIKIKVRAIPPPAHVLSRSDWFPKLSLREISRSFLSDWRPDLNLVCLGRRCVLR